MRSGRWVHYGAGLSILVLLYGFMALNTGCGTRPTPTGEQTLATPCEDCVEGVGNFAKVSDALWRGAQPSAQGFVKLDRMGVRTVVNFRRNHDDCGLLNGTKLKYLHIPAAAYHPEEADLVKFLKALENPDNWPVFVHCELGRDRTGYSVATYRRIIERWSPNDAIAEMYNFHFNPIWMGNPSFVRKLDVEKIKEMVKAAPNPRFTSCGQ